MEHHCVAVWIWFGQFWGWHWQKFCGHFKLLVGIVSVLYTARAPWLQVYLLSHTFYYTKEFASIKNFHLLKIIYARMSMLLWYNYVLFCQWIFTTSMHKNYLRASIHLPTLNTGVCSLITTVKINHTQNNSRVEKISIQNSKIITYFQHCPFTKFSYVTSAICSVFPKMS